MNVRLLSGQAFSHFGELWLAWSHGGGITSGMSYIQIVLGQSELASRKAVWWDLRLVSLLMHLFVFLWCFARCCADNVTGTSTSSSHCIAHPGSNAAAVTPCEPKFTKMGEARRG